MKFSAQYYSARPALGFSLVEVVIALGVISFALVAIIGLLPIGLATNRGTIQETRANHLAEEVFSTLRSQTFTSVNLTLLGSAAGPIDLSAENTAPGATGVTLHADYGGQFVGTNEYFTIELRFRNTPAGLITGTANEVHVQISARESGTPRMDYVSIIAAH
jgi:type II secretory pathway pseudopilin PulG